MVIAQQQASEVNERCEGKNQDLTPVVLLGERGAFWGGGNIGETASVEESS